MFRKTCVSIGAALALAAQPASAQDGLSEDDVFAAMAEMFAAEPLTAEQQARLPLAGEVVARIIPDGAMAEMIDNLLGGMLGPMMGMNKGATAAKVSERLGLYDADLAMETAQAEEALTILDPAWRERERIEAETMPAMMGEMMTTMEPVMKTAMTELYAVHFSTGELTDINAFFRTDTGASYARKSFTLASDPRLMASTMKAMPDMMGVFTTMGERMAAATASLPAQRDFAQLTAAEKARLAQLTGMSEEALEEGVDTANFEDATEEPAHAM